MQSNRALTMKVFSAYRQQKRVNKERVLIISLIDDLLKKESKLLRLEVQREMYDKVNKIKDKFWHDLLSLHLSLFSNNLFWHKELTSNLLTIGPYVTLMSGLDIKEFNNQLVVNFLIKTLMLLEKKNKDDSYKYLANRLANYSGDKLEYREIAKRFNASWSLNELRSLFENPRLQFLYFDFLLERMINRTTELEVQDQIKKVMIESIIKTSKVSQLWPLKYYYPADTKIRKLIINKMGQAWVHGTLSEKYGLINLLDQKSFKKGLGQRFREFKKPNFKIKREFYQSLLFSGKATTYAFYKLYQMGDRSPEYLWWLIF